MRTLDEGEFVRRRLLAQGQARWRKYASFVTGRPSFGALLAYELRTTLFGFVPGALGLYLRGKFFRPLFRRVGRNVVFGRNVTIRHGDKIELGDNVVIDDGVVLDARGAGDAGVIIGPDTIVGRNAIIQSKVGEIRIGASCNIGTYTVITSQGGVEIEDWVQIAGGCKLSGGRFKFDPDLKEGVPFKRLSAGPIRVGRCSLLGGSVQVTDGVTIGSCCMIGTGAIVMADIPEYSVYMPRPGMIMGKTTRED
jgi:acetyltransferase-like isoleucine patch superfamily enzyme